MQQNAVLQNGYLILCLTDNMTFGYTGEQLSITKNDNSNEDYRFIIAPNPFNSSFSFKVPENLIGKACEIIFYTINGLEVLRKKTIVGDKIKVDFAKAKLSSGLYLLHAKTGVENFYFKVTYLR